MCASTFGELAHRLRSLERRIKDQQVAGAIALPLQTYDRHGVTESLEIDGRKLRDVRCAMRSSTIDSAHVERLDVVKQVCRCSFAIVIPSVRESEGINLDANLGEEGQSFSGTDPLSSVQDATGLDFAIGTNAVLPSAFDDFLHFNHMRHPLRAFTIHMLHVCQEHLGAPEAAEVALALDLVDVPRTRVTEVGCNSILVKRTKICDGTWKTFCLVRDHAMPIQSAIAGNSLYGLRLRAIDERFANVGGHALLESVRTKLSLPKPARISRYLDRTQIRASEQRGGP